MTFEPQENKIFQNLQDRVVQEAPIKLIHAHNIYKAFDKGNIEFNGSFGE
jgi:hypothetical protein